MIEGQVISVKIRNLEYGFILCDMQSHWTNRITICLSLSLAGSIIISMHLVEIDYNILLAMKGPSKSQIFIQVIIRTLLFVYTHICVEHAIIKKILMIFSKGKLLQITVVSSIATNQIFPVVIKVLMMQLLEMINWRVLDLQVGEHSSRASLGC